MTTSYSIILPFQGIFPKIDATAFVAPGAVIVGDVEIGPESSIWFGCVIRSDVNRIRIGLHSNIQDGSVIHVAAAGSGTIIGDHVTVGHCVLLHECTLEDYSFVGMRATVMDGAKIKSRGMLAAGSLLTPQKVVPSGQLWAGSPAKYWRELTLEDIAEIELRARQYVMLKEEYLR